MSPSPRFSHKAGLLDGGGKADRRHMKELRDSRPALTEAVTADIMKLEEALEQAKREANEL
jgi:hypothetical protein